MDGFSAMLGEEISEITGDSKMSRLYESRLGRLSITGVLALVEQSDWGVPGLELVARSSDACRGFVLPEKVPTLGEPSGLFCFGVTQPLCNEFNQLSPNA